MTDRDTERSRAKPGKAGVTIDLEAEHAATTGGRSASTPPEGASGPETSPAGDREPRRTSQQPPQPPEPPQPPTPPTPPIPPPRQPGAFALVTAGLVGAVLAIVLLLFAETSGLLRTPATEGADSAILRVAAVEASVSANTETVRSLRDKVERMDEQLDAQVRDLAVADAGQGEVLAGLSGDLTELRALVERAARSGGVTSDDLAAGLADLETRLPDAVTPADVAAAVGQLETRLEDRLAAAEDRSAVEAEVASVRDAVTGRVEALEGEVAALGERIGQLFAAIEAKPPPMSATGVMGVLLLERAAAAGGPFTPTVEAVADVLPETDDLAKLRELAAEGAPSLDELRRRFPGVEEAMRAAYRVSLAPPDDIGTGERFGQMLEGMFGGIVSVRTGDQPAARDDDAGIEALAAALAAGDLQTVVREQARLSAAVQRASADWTADVGRRLTVDRLVADVVAAAGSER